MRESTLNDQRRLYLLARITIARHYRRPLTVAIVARSLASSPRQLQRAYARAGGSTFREDLIARRMAVAAELLVTQRSLAVAQVARLVGYRQAPHFARAFKARYGVTPARFRAQALRRSSAVPRAPAAAPPSRPARGTGA